MTRVDWSWPGEVELSTGRRAEEVRTGRAVPDYVFAELPPGLRFD